MQCRQIIISACIVLMVSLFPITTSDASEYVTNYDRINVIGNAPPRAGIWKRTPTVVVCEDAPITKEQVTAAVSLWKSLGHNFFRTQYKYDPLHKCKQKKPVGYITIRLVTQELALDEDSLAETHFYIDNTSRAVEHAIIYIKLGIPETVLEHELGHALGFLHFNKINHLMNSKWTQGGWDTKGLANKRR